MPHGINQINQAAVKAHLVGPLRPKPSAGKPRGHRSHYFLLSLLSPVASGLLTVSSHSGLRGPIAHLQCVGMQGHI
jgi:hypothetical protein